MLLKYKFQNMMITLKSFGAFANSRSVMGIPKLQRYPHLTVMGVGYYAGEYIEYPCLSKIDCINSHTSNKCNLSMSSIN